MLKFLLSKEEEIRLDSFDFEATGIAGLAALLNALLTGCSAAIEIDGMKI